MAAFESKASFSNLNLVSPERLLDSRGYLTARLLIEGTAEGEPWTFGSRFLPVFDGDSYLLVVFEPCERLGEFQDVAFSVVLGENDLTHRDLQDKF